MPLGLAISLLSAAVIAYEILLMRMLSIAQWHYFASMIISLALLGYGASGTVLALARRRVLRHFDSVFPAAAALFGLTAVAGFAAAERIPFNPLELFWDRRQVVLLTAQYLVLAVPFFCAAMAVGLAFCRFGDRAGAVYRYDLVGAGAGAIGVIAGLYALPPTLALTLVGAAGLTAAAIARVAGRGRRWPAAALLAAALVLVLSWPDELASPRLSPYKALSQALRVPESRVVAERSSPLGLLSVVESPRVPLRHAPGLSLNWTGDIPPQVGVFVDGDGPTAITRDADGGEALAYLDFLPAALPYYLLPGRPRVLVLGAGGGMDVLLARRHDARAVDAVEIDPQLVALVRSDYANFAGRIYDRPEVRVHVAEARGFAAAAKGRYELVQLSLLDSFASAGAGLQTLSPSTLYTVEAFATYLDRLAPGGLLAITRWLKLPPRDSLKLFATAVAALERGGVTDPEARLVLVRSWNTVTLLVKNGRFTSAEIAAIKQFCDARSFDVAYYPGMPAAEANRYNRLDRPYLYEAARALLGPDRAAYLRDYKFDITPATDDRPYFFRSFKWRTLPELLSLGSRRGLPLMDWGYVVLLVTLVQAIPVAALLILAPLPALGRRRRGSAAPVGQWRGATAVCFLALGLGFLFVEIALIQRFTLFLDHPIYAIATVLGAVLVFAGFGGGVSSGLTRRLARSRAAGRRLPGAAGLAIAGIVGFVVLYLVILPELLGWLKPIAFAGRIGLSVALIAPLAFLMGMPFPLALARLSGRAPALVPWAWGLNGCASVLSPLLATLLAVHFGFSAVMALAAALYVAAAGGIRRLA